MKNRLVFLHGGPGFNDYLEPYFRELSDAFDCLFYDQSRGSTIGIDDLVSQLEVNVGDQKSVLVGHSWGGVLATEFAIRHPDKVSGIVLMSTGLSNTQWVEYHQDLDDLGLGDAPPEEIFLAPGDPPSAREFLRQIDRTFSGKTFDQLNNSYLKKFDLTVAIPNIPIKIMNLYGEKDLRFPPRVAQKIHQLNTKIETHQIEGAGHFPFLQPANRDKIHQLLRANWSIP